MSDCFLESVEKRRSIYHLGKDIPLHNNELIKKIELAMKAAPSAFNSQSARIVILLGINHQRLWHIVQDVLKPLVSPDKFQQTKEKLDSFAAGYGTILFFEEMETVRNLQDKFSLYKDMFPVWAEQSNGMLQYVLWTLLAENNIGASLQHYNPLIDDAVHQEWHLPHNWRLIAQMPFGSIEQPAGEKTFLPMEERIKIFY